MYYADKYGNSSFDPSDYEVEDTTDTTDTADTTDTTDTTESDDTSDTLTGTDTADISESTSAVASESDTVVSTDEDISEGGEDRSDNDDLDGTGSGGSMILYLCLTLGALCVVTLISAAIALKMRTEKQ